ncbi:uncharacterized protein [Halyomorpha halys]|uniref:uncharacterized protein n=1 Tax=Halyomorpha halys TaxID=286706 RepID=UPI0034D15501
MYRHKLYESEVYSDASSVSAEEYDVVVLKNIDPATDPEKIFQNLENLGYKVHSITRAVNNNTREAAPMFYVELVKSHHNASIIGMKRIVKQNVIVEKYIKNPGILKCTICQANGHQSLDCIRFPVCARCRGRHVTKRCNIGRDIPPPCLKCGRQNFLNFKGCYIYRRRFLELLRKDPEKKVPAEELIKMALEKDSTMVQTEGVDRKAAPGVPSGDCRACVEYSLLCSLAYTEKMIQLDNIKNTLEVTLDHYITMHHEWRSKILSPPVEEKS